jgi:hypothetical protein
MMTRSIIAISGGHCRSSPPHASSVGQLTLRSVDQYGGAS